MSQHMARREINIDPFFVFYFWPCKLNEAQSVPVVHQVGVSAVQLHAWTEYV